MAELLAWLTHQMPANHPFATVPILPDVPGWPEPWLLGSSQSSPPLAGRLGLPFAFAGFIAPSDSPRALGAYRRAFRPSSSAAGITTPYAILALHVVCAETRKEAERLAMPVRHMYAQLSQGRLLRRLATPDEAIDAFGGLIAAEEEPWPRFIVGDPERVASVLGRMIEETHPDEIMIQDLITEHRARVCSYELLADAFGLRPVRAVAATS